MIRSFYSIIMIVVLICTSKAQNIDQTRESHPHSPDDTTHSDFKYTDPELAIQSDVKALTDQETWLRSQLRRFPTPASSSTFRQERYGALCTIPEEGDNSPLESWFELKLNLDHDILFEGIALVPALFPEHSTTENYAFPKRFKIEGFKTDAPNTPILIADWTSADFPDPSLAPVIFNAKDLYIQKIRLTVTKGIKERGKHIFALDEMLIFRYGLNIAPLITKRLNTSHPTLYPPYWHPSYLVDGTMHLGTYVGPKPLSEPTGETDFVLYYSPQMISKQEDLSTTIIIDLGQERSIGRVEFYAAHDPDSPIPNLPLPHNYKLEILDSLEPEIIKKSFPIQQTDYNKIRHHPFYSFSGRYLRCTFTLLPVYNKRPVLALGEVRVVGDDGDKQGLLELNKKVTLTSSYPASINQKSSIAALVDGLSNGQTITMEQTFIQQLAKRDLVEKIHQQVTEQLTIAKAAQAQTYRTVAICLIALTAAIIIILFNRIQHQKRQEILTLQKQISADLHDDISGNLGTIAMISKRIQKITDKPKVEEKLREIEHLSKESYMSVKEIIWHSDAEIVHFSDLINQIQRTAESITNDCNVTYKLPLEACETMEKEVPVRMRRNIILLVKESLFNCAKYANAKNILITVDLLPSVFTLIMKDDGCGFDSSQGLQTNTLSGRGLLNMEQRAKLLGANLSIKSDLGQGTEVKLTMPLKNN